MRSPADRHLSARRWPCNRQLIADLSWPWLSQYPHEREVLLPPLTGVEALHSDVEGNMLVIQSRFSLNLSAQTLEQVLMIACDCL